MSSDILAEIRKHETEISRLWIHLADPTADVRDRRVDALEISSGGVDYLVQVGSVREVIQMVLPQSLADSPIWVAGTFQFGGQGVAVIDLALRMGGNPTRLHPDLALVVIDSPAWIGLAVDDIGDVVAFETSDLTQTHPGIPRSRLVVGTLPRAGREPSQLLSLPNLVDEIGGRPWSPAEPPSPHTDKEQ